MSRLIFILRKFVGNIFGRPLASATAILSLILLLIMIDLAWITSLTGNRYFENQLNEMRIEAFFYDDITDSTALSISKVIRNMDETDSVLFISREDARSNLQSIMGADLLEGFDENPLPRSVVISFDEQFLKVENIGEFITELGGMSGIEEIYYPGEWMQGIEYSRSLLEKFVLILAAVIVITAVLNLLQAMRLSARGRSEEIFQLRLLGAGRDFLAIPNVLEGFFYGLVASALGWLAIFYGAGEFSFQNFDIILPQMNFVIYYCAGVSIVGMFAGYAAIRKSL